MDVMWDIPRMWEGGECYIIGGGFSLMKQLGVPDDVVSAVIDKKESPEVYSPYFTPLKDKHVIGCNAAIKLGNWIDVILFGDSSFKDKFRQDILDFTKLVVSCDGVTNHHVLGIKRVGRDSHKIYGITSKPNRVSWNHNTGSAAISLAVHFGVKRIVLCGFDMKFTDGNQHWHRLYGKKDEAKMDSTFSRHMKGMDLIAADAEALGVEIINANPDSQITQFKKMPLLEVLAMGKPRPEPVPDQEPVKVMEIIDTPQHKIGVVTPHRSPERKPFLDFLRKRIAGQTRKVDHWALMDYPALNCKPDLADRYLKGIQECFDNGCDLVLFMEDDDYYPLTYVRDMYRKWLDLDTPVLIGVNNVTNYHIKTTGYRPNTEQMPHCSAFCTAVAPGVNLDIGSQPNKFFDVKLWKVNQFRSIQVGFSNRPVGIKHGIGLCGGRFHRIEMYHKFDLDRKVLARMVDREGLKFYKEIVDGK